MAGTANVKWVRPALKKMLVLYRTIQDCLDGEVQVKKRTTTYLPKPNAADISDANEARYTAYLFRAVFYNVTARTLRGLVGQVFMREPIVKVPSTLDIVVANADGEGVTLIQSAQKSDAQVTSKGRAGLFTDYPVTKGIVTKEELDKGDVRPTITRYDAENIINWRTKTRGAKTLYSLIVLQETYEVADDGFEVKEEPQYRVLKLGSVEDQENDESPSTDVYSVDIWRSNDKNGFSILETYIPTDASGSPLNEIPFDFIGAENNDSEIDNPPMYDLASLNIAHYRNSADYEESCYIVGQPTPWFSGLTEEWVNKVLNGVIPLGSRGAIPLPVGAEAGLLQAEPNTMPHEAMQHKERQMVALGAKLVEQREVERTATEAKLETSAETSVLGMVADNVSAAYARALKWCAMFIGAPTEGIEFQLNTDFDISKLSAKDREQLIAEWQAEAISYTEMRDSLRKVGVATQDDDVSQKEIAKNPPIKEEPENDDSQNDDNPPA